MFVRRCGGIKVITFAMRGGVAYRLPSNAAQWRAMVPRGEGPNVHLSRPNRRMRSGKIIERSGCHLLAPASRLTAAFRGETIRAVCSGTVCGVG
jgi:hypothetical protein